MNRVSRQVGAFAGGALLVIGSLMTWISVDLGFRAFSSTGTESTEGKLTLAAGLVLVILGLLTLRGIATGRVVNYIAAATAAFGAVVLLLEYFDVRERIAEADGTGVTAAVGAGVWIAALGAVVALGATAWAAVAESRAR